MTSDPHWEWRHAFGPTNRYPREELASQVEIVYGKHPRRRDVWFLDLGCGQGAVSWMLAREGYSVVALDSSVSALQRLGDRMKADNLVAHRVMADMSQVPLPDGSMDCVVDNMSSCCVPQKEWVGVMGEVRRVLRWGGHYLARFPQPGSIRDDGVHTWVWNWNDFGLYFRQVDWGSADLASCGENRSYLDVVCVK